MTATSDANHAITRLAHRDVDGIPIKLLPYVVQAMGNTSGKARADIARLINYVGRGFENKPEHYGWTAAVFNFDPRGALSVTDVEQYVQFAGWGGDEEKGHAYMVNAACKSAAFLLPDAKYHELTSTLRMRYSADADAADKEAMPGEAEYELFFGKNSWPKSQVDVAAQERALVVFPWGGSRLFVPKTAGVPWILFSISGFTQEEDDFVTVGGRRIILKHHG